ncbi:MAG TPA: hypothetical protein VGD98_09810 [Ktedonobacteraceae bacterium]
MSFLSDVKDRLRRKNTSPPETAPQQPPNADPDDSIGPVLPVPGPDTGPLRPHWPWWGRGAQIVDDGSHLSAFERQRKLIDSFDEDHLERPDKIKLWIAKWASIVLPVIAVWAIGGELGQYFAGGQLFSWTDNWAMSQYLIAYAGEVALAVLTYSLGHAAGQKDNGSSYKVKMSITTGVWLLFLAASAAGQWYVAVATLHPSQSMQTAIAIRVGMSCSLDIAAVCLMWWRGKTLAKFLESQMKRAEAIRAVNESELTIEAAQGLADRRRKEDEQYQESKKRREDVIIRLEELQGQALISQAERLLLPGGGNSYDRNNW